MPTRTPRLVELAFGETLGVSRDVVRKLWFRMSPWLSSTDRYYLHQAERDWDYQSIAVALKRIQPRLIFQACEELWPPGRKRPLAVRKLEQQVLDLLDAEGRWRE